MTRRLMILMIALMMGLAAPVLGQEDAILSKEDAAVMFALSKQQWNQNVMAVANSGLATAIEGSDGVLKMGSRTPQGWGLLVSPAYGNGDARPSDLQVVVVYPEPHASAFTEETAGDLEEKAAAEMNPEYDVTAFHEKADIGFTFYFYITESRK